MKSVFKALVGVLLIIGLLVFGFTGCIDPDEALPHYHVSGPEAPQ